MKTPILSLLLLIPLSAHADFNCGESYNFVGDFDQASPTDQALCYDLLSESDTSDSCFTQQFDLLNQLDAVEQNLFDGCMPSDETIQAFATTHRSQQQKILRLKAQVGRLSRELKILRRSK